jgi:hypothetical protein
MEYWRHQIEQYEASGQTREAYSAAQGIKLHTLDYWRRKFTRTPEVKRSGDSWLPVKIFEEESVSIDLNVGKVRITVRPGFNQELLCEVLRVLAV